MEMKAGKSRAERAQKEAGGVKEGSDLVMQSGNNTARPKKEKHDRCRVSPHLGSPHVLHQRLDRREYFLDPGMG
jgi:hypothetical protein